MLSVGALPDRKSHDWSTLRYFQRSFERIQADAIDKTFLTLQKVMEKVFENESGINFQLPRVKKFHFARGAHPSSLPIAYVLVSEGISSCKEWLI